MAFLEPIYEYIRLSRLSREGSWICRLCGCVVPDDSRIRQIHRTWHKELE